MIELVLDKVATDSEANAIKQAFEDAGLPAEVSVLLVESRSATPPPWVIFVTVTTASIFLSGFVAAAGADAWTGLRDLVVKMFRAREKSKAPTGTVILKVKDARELIVFSDGLPDAAFRSVVETEIVHTESGQLNWDPKTRSWRDSFEIGRDDG